jgi:opacity protein-like surface antigen
MKRTVFLVLAASLLLTPALFAQALSGDHVEVGVFTDYFGLERTKPHTNYVGLGARAAFNLRPDWQLEGEMNYDFKRDFTSAFSNGVTTQLVNTRLRNLHALFGPKYNFGSGSFRPFVTGKVGFVNFSVSDQNAAAGFKGALGGVTSGNTRPAFYPGVGVEGFFAGRLGLRLEAGDEVYFDGGTRHNLRVSFGPQLRF